VKTSDTETAIRRLEPILRQCEIELLEMAYIQKDGAPSQETGNFQTPIFRFVWVKLFRPILNQGKFYSKGLRY